MRYLIILLMGFVVVATNAQNSQYEPGIVIVQFDPGVNHKTGLNEFNQIANRYEVYSIERRFPFLDIVKPTATTEKNLLALRQNYSVRYHTNALPEKVAKSLNLVNGITYAEPVPLRKIESFISDIPNDVAYQIFQGYLNRLEFPEAWKIVKGENISPRIIIAIVDSGVDWIHEDLSTNIWINEDEIEDNGIDDDNNGFIDDINGWGFCATIENGECVEGPDPNNPAADHGTAAAGVPGAITNNEIGIAGAAWNVDIMPIAANPSLEPIGVLHTLFVQKGVLYAAMNGADIINASYAGENLSNEEREVIELATNMGSLVVAAAANQERDIDQGPGIYPAQFPGVLSVGSVIGNKLEGYSNYGSSVDVFTHGTLITTVRNSEYTIASGTSFSTPLASAVAALVKTKNPTWTPEMIRLHIMATADKIDRFNPERKGKLGFGKINVLKAVTKEYNSSGVLVKNITSSNYEVVPSEIVKISVELKSFIQNVSNFSIRLVEDQPSPFITWTTQEVNIGEIVKDNTVTAVFEFIVADNVSIQEILDLGIELRIDNQVISVGQVDPIKILRNFDLDILAKTFFTLKEIYRVTNGDQWDDNSGWDTTAMPGLITEFDSWYGVTIRNDNVNQLSFTANNLTGEIPPEIGNLTEMTFLALNANNLTGELPKEIGNLTKMENLWLSENKLTGTIPSEIGNLLELKYLDLAWNQLSGSIPIEFENLTKLRYLYIDNNQLVESLPHELLHVKNLNTFHFNENLSLCAPTDDVFQNWLNDIQYKDGPNCTTGVAIENNPETDDIQIYPNPVIDYVTFKNVPYDTEIEIFDVLGRKVLSTNKRHIDMSELAHGLYVYIISSENKRVSGKLIKH